MTRTGPIRILHIGRYRSAAAERKLELLAAQPDLSLFLVRPAVWADEYGRVEVRPRVSGCQVVTVPMLGRPNDPHRSLYRTLSFGVWAARPHLIHAEEEPDSLAALQVALVRTVLAPGAKLVLHTWQNVNRRDVLPRMNPGASLRMRTGPSASVRGPYAIPAGMTRPRAAPHGHYSP